MRPLTSDRDLSDRRHGLPSHPPRCPQMHSLWTILWVPVSPTNSGNTPDVVHRRPLRSPIRPQREPRPDRSPHAHASSPGNPGNHTLLVTHMCLRTSMCTPCARAAGPGDDDMSPTTPAASSTSRPHGRPQDDSPLRAAWRRLSTSSTPPMTTMSPLSIRSLPHAWLLALVWMTPTGEADHRMTSTLGSREAPRPRNVGTPRHLRVDPCHPMTSCRRARRRVGLS